MPRIDLKGKRFGKLLVLAMDGVTPYNGSVLWKVRCACGTVKTVDGQHLRRPKNPIRSCGCGRLAKRDGVEPPPVDGARWIALGGGGHALVDAEDFGWLSARPWHLHDGYAVRFERGHIVRMARCILQHHGLLALNDLREVDHERGSRLDNRKAKLRVAGHSQNGMNRGPQQNNTTGFKGVTRLKTGRYAAQIGAGGRHFHVGVYDTPEAAARAYDDAAKRLHGAFSRPNGA